MERLNKEVKRRADVVGIFPNEESIYRLIGAVLLEANDEWQLQHRYMQIEGMAELATPMIEETLKIAPQTALPMATSICTRIYTSLTDATLRPREAIALSTTHTSADRPALVSLIPPHPPRRDPSSPSARKAEPLPRRSARLQRGGRNRDAERACTAASQMRRHVGSLPRAQDCAFFD